MKKTDEKTGNVSLEQFMKLKMISLSHNTFRKSIDFTQEITEKPMATAYVERVEENHKLENEYFNVKLENGGETDDDETLKLIDSQHIHRLFLSNSKKQKTNNCLYKDTRHKIKVKSV